MSDMAGKAASGRGLRAQPRYNGADGISDIEVTAVTGSGEQAGTRASFNFSILNSDASEVPTS